MRRASQQCISPISALESRQLLAGSVQATVTGGSLKITGDLFANEISIDQTVSGLRVRASGGTRLNGTTNGELFFINPTLTTIDLKAGNDQLTLASFLGGGVSVQMGHGNDQLVLSGITTDGDLVVDLGYGNDGLLAKSGGPLSSDPNVVGGNVRLLGNVGDDRMVVQSLNALRNLTLDSGVGNDTVLLGSGSTDGTSSILLGTGNDILSIGARTSRGLFSMNAGSGDDLVGSQSARFLEAATFDMGIGKDALLSQLNTFQANVTRAGGFGIDTLFASGDTLFAGNTISGFETQPTTVAPVQTLLNRMQATFA